MPNFPRPLSTRQVLAQVQRQLGRIEEKVDRIMSEQTTQQTDINNAAQFDQQLDTDVKGLAAQVTAGQAALDQAIALLKAANPTVDTSVLTAAQAVLAGDQPTLDAAVAALGSDVNVTPAAPAPDAPAAS